MKRKTDIPANISAYQTQSRGTPIRPTVKCSISRIRLCRGGTWVDGIQAVCLRCGQLGDAFGTEMKSVHRSLAVLHEKCLEKEDNFYIVDLEEGKES